MCIGPKDIAPHGVDCVIPQRHQPLSSWKMSAEVAEDNNIAAQEAEAENQGEDGSPDKKETFQWNTPADEFAEDVGSDIDEESEDEGGEGKSRRANDANAEEIHYSEVTNGQIDISPGKRSLDGSAKKSKVKNQFPCPKCNKIWNWPWELRRHLVMHFKEVRKQKHFFNCF